VKLVTKKPPQDQCVEGFSPAASRLLGKPCLDLLGRIFSLARDLARELADENAYQRHLRATGSAPSTAEWKAFSDHRNRRKYQNAKCC
jgi:hypothetical protein